MRKSIRYQIIFSCQLQQARKKCQLVYNTCYVYYIIPRPRRLRTNTTAMVRDVGLSTAVFVWQKCWLSDNNVDLYKLKIVYSILVSESHVKNKQETTMVNSYMSPVKRICVFEHSVMTHFNCACPAIQKGQGSGFLSEGSSWLSACMSEQRRFWRDCADAQARLNLRCSHRR